MRAAVERFGASYLAGEGDRACELMTPRFEEEFVNESNANVLQLAEGAPALSDCPSWVELDAALRYGQVGPDRTEADQREGARQREAEIDRLESAELKAIDISEDRASVSHVPGFDELTLVLARVDDEWLVDRLATKPPELEVSEAAERRDGNDLIECDAGSGTVRLTTPAGSIDRVTPAWRRADGAIRIRFVSKSESAIVEGDRICSGSADWSRVELSLGDLSDETQQFGINRQFRHLPDTVRFFVDAGDGEFDEIRGYNGSDRLYGGGGQDELRGYGGRDRLIGGPGKDDLFASGQRDVIEAADGEADFVRCGYGKDTALVDQRDDVKTDCERVRERDR